jgi:TolA-binding protein
MHFRRNYGCLLGVIGICLLVSNAYSRNGIESRANVVRRWFDLGRAVLYQSGAGHGPSVPRLDQELDAVDPNSREAVRTAEAILMKALDDYGREAIAIMGRIPLDVNPQCILGLYSAERFPGTQLGDWGSKQFGQCIEQACLVAKPGAQDIWRTRFGTGLLATDEIQQGTFLGGAFSLRAEVPYLYHYLINNADSANARNKAREYMARCLWQEYGLEPGLRQYLVLLDQGCTVDGTWLELAKQFERVGARTRAKRIYEQIFGNTNSVEKAREAFEALAQILLAESRPGQAWAAWGEFSERFPNGVCTVQAIREFLDSFPNHRAQTSKRFDAELAQTSNESQALQLCRHFDGLWTPNERVPRWRTVVDDAPPGSLADQFSRVFLAWALLDGGRVDSAEVVVRGLPESVNPSVQAQRLAVLAEIAHAGGRLDECVRLYGQAVKTDRQSPLPSWCRQRIRVPSPDANMPRADLEAQRLFLRGYCHLMDGDYTSAAAILEQAAAEAASLSDSMRGLLPSVMILAYLGAEDYVEAETWGRQALAQCRAETPGDTAIKGLEAHVKRLDTAVFELLSRVRDTSSPVAASVVLEQAIRICDAGVNLSLSRSDDRTIGGGLQKLYVWAKRRQIGQLLIAEYRYARQRCLENGKSGPSLNIEPLFFAGQVLRNVPFDQIRKSFASVTEDEGVKDRMYRFARFALKAKRPDLASSALDVGPGEQLSAGAVEVLQDVAQMYLAASNHQKAIDTYEMIAANAEDPGKVQIVRLKIIDIYAESLKNYNKAIQECQKFVQMYPDSAQTSQVEFLMGKLSYLGRDYGGAVGQLDGFLNRYPKHPKVGQAMLLAGLSRMTEGKIPEAVGRFTQIIRRYPEGDLAARSKFLIGYAQVSEQQYGTALETFKQLIEQFPRSQYVPQARSLIERLNRISQ